jgi:hypothetical protein
MPASDGGSEPTSKFEGRTPMANIEYFENKMMMVKDHRTQCAQTLHNGKGARSKGERYAFRATNGRARNIVGVRFTI